MTKIQLLVAAAAFAAIPAVANATLARSWISGHGVDQAGCGPVANPCRTLQYAHDNTNAGGEIDVLDAAGYGSVVITKAINIINDGSGVAGVLASSGGNAVTINAGPGDRVGLQGLTIEGSGTGLNGIVFNSGGALGVRRSSIYGFTGTGVIFAPTRTTAITSLYLTGDIYNNGTAGIQIQPQGAAKVIAAMNNLSISGS